MNILVNLPRLNPGKDARDGNSWSQISYPGLVFLLSNHNDGVTRANIEIMAIETQMFRFTAVDFTRNCFDCLLMLYVICSGWPDGSDGSAREGGPSRLPEYSEVLLVITAIEVGYLEETREYGIITTRRNCD